MCPMSRLHFKLVANNLEGYLEECLEKDIEESGKMDTEGEENFLVWKQESFWSAMIVKGFLCVSDA